MPVHSEQYELFGYTLSVWLSWIKGAIVIITLL